MPALLGALLCAAGLLAIPGKAPAQAQKPYPGGIYWLTNSDADINSSAVEWGYSFVDGIRLRETWDFVQPTSSTSFTWSTIDTVLGLAAQHGKKVGVSISSGVVTPQWVYDHGATKYRLQDGSGNSMPIPWDSAYQSQWLTFVRAFGARYDGNPNLAYVIITGMGQGNTLKLAETTQDEANLATNAVQSGYPDLSTAYLSATEAIISSAMGAFPTTACIVTLQAPFPDLGDLQDTVKDWGIAAYPLRFGTMRNALMAVPAPHDPPPPPIPYPFGYQMICSAVDDPATLYKDPDPVPMPTPPIPLQDALENGVSLGSQYVEVYKTDLELGIDWPVLTAEGVKLKANLPTATPTPTPAPTPAPPTALAATDVTTKSFIAHWSSVSGATGYRLDASKSQSFTSYVPGYQNLNVGNTTSSSVNAGLKPNTNYYYRLRAYNGNGTSPNSNVISVTTTRR